MYIMEANTVVYSHANIKLVLLPLLFINTSTFVQLNVLVFIDGEKLNFVVFMSLLL